MNNQIYVSTTNYKGGTNNLWVATDINGIVGSSFKSKSQAIKNYKKNYKKCK